MKTYTYHTAHKVLLGDLHTPVEHLSQGTRSLPQSALMESSDYHGSENNRSFIAFNPIASISINHGTATMNFPDDTCMEKELGTNFTAEDAINRFSVVLQSIEGEYSHYCGLYGYTTFNAVRYFEDIPVKDSHEPKNDAPEILYILYKYLIVFNDFKSEMVLIEMQDVRKKVT